jgi:hypothetical protein
VRHVELTAATIGCRARKTQHPTQFYSHLLLLSRIVKLIESVDKQIDLADGKMIDALWHQKFGNQPAVQRLVIEAVTGYRKLANFDVAAKERYMARKFPEVWPSVIASVGDWVPPT